LAAPTLAEEKLQLVIMARLRQCKIILHVTTSETETKK